MPFRRGDSWYDAARHCHQRAIGDRRESDLLTGGIGIARAIERHAQVPANRRELMRSGLFEWDRGYAEAMRPRLAQLTGALDKVLLPDSMLGPPVVAPERPPTPK